MASHPMTPRQRLEACLSGARLDRPPVSLWRHFPVDDQTPEGLAAATLEFQNAYQFDFVKVTPASSFCLKDWGAQDSWRGSPEGTRTYTHRVIQTPEDWHKLVPLDPTQGYLGAQLACLRLLAAELRSQQVPLVQTIFNPLSQAKNLVGGDQLPLHLRLYPEAVHAGLQTIVETTRRFIEASLQIGIDGIFFAVQHASYRLLSREEYTVFGQTYDLQVLEPARSLWLNLLHLHGEDVMFPLIADYPVQVINWHDRDTPPSLKQGKRRFPGVVCGGLQRETSMVLGTPEQVTAEAMDAIRTTGGERFILGTGCVVPIIAPRANLLAARRSVEKPLPGLA